jgi:tetratricopeptide (TPR) repeat protein
MENYKLAIECYNDCLRATEELNDDHNIAFVLQRMGEIQLTRLHKYSDATKLFLDALELLRAEECMSEEDQCSVLCLIFQVGQAYALAKDYENALDFYEEHIKLVESREPVDDELVANSLLEMGMILSVMGDKPDYELAAEKVSESLNIRRKILGPDNEQVADVLFKLAEIYEKSEEYTQAVDCLSESLRTFKMKNMYSKASAAYHTLAKLKASAAEKSGADSDRKAAIECYEAAISTRRQDPALDDLELASMLYEYATLQCLDNNYDSATPLLNEALCIQKSKKGLKNERVANILLRTAECHVHGNKYDASLLCLEQALFIQSSLEKCDIDAVLLNHLLGITYLERENYPKAVSTSLAALKLMKMEGCEDSLECADVYNNLGKAYGKLHDYDKAIESLVEGKLFWSLCGFNPTCLSLTFHTILLL